MGTVAVVAGPFWIKCSCILYVCTVQSVCTKAHRPEPCPLATIVTTAFVAISTMVIVCVVFAVVPADSDIQCVVYDGMYWFYLASVRTGRLPAVASMIRPDYTLFGHA